MVAGTGQETQVVEIIVIGLTKSGKTTFIKTISHQTQLEGDKEYESWLLGRLPIDEGLTVHFMEPPALGIFDFLWVRDLIDAADVAGYIVLLDSASTETFGEAMSILNTIRALHPETPVVLAANKQDDPAAWRPEDLRLAMGIPEDIPVLPCVATHVGTVKETVLQLPYRIFGI